MNDASTLAETLRKFRAVDLSQALEEHMPNYPTHSKFYHNLWGSYWHGDRALTYQLVLNEHNGTHVDAPAHFISDAKPQAHVTIEQVPLGRLMGGVRGSIAVDSTRAIMYREASSPGGKPNTERSGVATSCCLISAGRRTGDCARTTSVILRTGRESAWTQRSTSSKSR